MSKPTLVVAALIALVIGVACFGFLGARDSGFPLVYNPASFVSPDEIRQIEQLVRNRGERYVVSINIVSTNKAGATTGHESYRPRSGRKYDVRRTADGWKIHSVEEWKN
jgi:hypothetical protein